MEKITKSVTYTKGKYAELKAEYRNVADAAIRAAKRAHAPYSNFFVGAAVLLDNGKLIEGNNQENAAYPSGLCAERVALFFAGSQFPEASVRILAVHVTELPSDVLVPPCGACLQVIKETETRQKDPMEILLVNSEFFMLAEGVQQFMPLAFSRDYFPV
ncbi:MAG: cytidine deaminase [Cryomorphaceae bacterium]|nr:cytidine deaminase [Cryomorphaceae bacterium]